MKSLRPSGRLVRRAMLLSLLGLALLTGLSTSPAAAPPALTPGNLVIYRVGTGAAALSNAAQPVFLDEYTPAGTLVQSLALPTAVNGSNRRLAASGTATSEGLLSRSADGQYLIVPGYDAAAGTAAIAGTTSAAVNRVVGRVDAGGAVDTTTALSDWASGNNPRGATSSNGVDLWVSGASGGSRYTTLGAATSTQLSSTVTNLRATQIVDGQLYVSDSSGATVRLGAVGSGLPTTAGQTIVNLPGFPTSGSPYGFFFADLDAAVPGLDTLYVASDDAAALTKYSLVAGNWAINGTVGVAADTYRGLAGVANGSSVTLYATRKGGSGATGGGELVSLTDASGYNGAFSGTPTLLATAATNTAFRGIVLAPGSAAPVATPPSITTHPAGQTVVAGSTAALAVSVSGSTPLNYQWYQGPAGVTTTPVGTDAPTFTSPGLFADISYWVRVTNSVGSADSLAALIQVVTPQPACSAVDLPIGTIQGSGASTPLAGQTVTVQGVVVGDYEGPSPALRGFYLQDQTPDGDPSTSDAVFVFNANGNTVGLGDVVQVSGTVVEFQNQTQIENPSIEACGSTATVTLVDVVLPVPAPVAGVAYLERFEGMLVRFPQTLTVTEMFQLGRFGQVVMSAAGRLPQPTNVAAPGGAAVAQQAANDLNRLLVDDDLQNQNPDPVVFGRNGNPLSASNTLRGGDTATGMVGVLTYTWAGNAASPNNYRLRPIGALGGGVPNFLPSNQRPVAPPPVGGRLRVVGMNVLNYFLTLDDGQPACGPIGSKQTCRGAESVTERTRQQDKLVAALVALDADVIGLSELENTQDAAGKAVNPLADIVLRLNAAVGSTEYGYIDTGIAGTDTIRVGLIYRFAAVTPVGVPLIDANLVHNRPPVAQLFRESSTGERFSVVVNHFKSKGCSATSALADADQGDGQGCFNATRVQQAQALVSFVGGTVVPAAGDTDVLLVGDFNAYAKEDPIATIEQAGFTNLVSRFSGVSAHSYVFDGQWGYLDHALASASLLPQVTGTGDYHINADEPGVLDYNTNFKSAGQIVGLYAADQYRIADHDPVVVGLALQALPQATGDAYTATVDTTLTPATGVLANDTGGPFAIVSHTAPSHGALTVNADGTFTYTPAAGFTGHDQFSYSVSNAVQLFRSNLPPLDVLGSVSIGKGAFGSALTPVPGSTDEYFGLTDRGPNVDGPGGTKVEPIPTFTPAIGRFRLANGQAILLQEIPLQSAGGTQFSGRVNSQANTGETILDLNGAVLPPDPNGYDPEGLVALPDGTFWVSDEYGPFMAHVDGFGRETQRLSPFNGALPAELAHRVVNRGMEGLTITPDGSTLVGIMQSALQQPDLGGFDAKKLTPLRIVTYRLADGATHEYLYLLDNPNTNKTAVSEIAAVSNSTFLVIERDGNFLPGAYKKVFLIDLAGATDVGPGATVAGATYDPGLGLLVGGKTIENLLRTGNSPFDTATSATALTAAGITPAAKSLSIDVGALLNGLDPQGRFFAHDKLEGLALAGPGKLVISNDSDFGIDGVTTLVPPFALHAKVTPAGVQDDGEFLVIDLTRPSTVLSTATVDLTVTAPPPPPPVGVKLNAAVSPGSGKAGVTVVALTGSGFPAGTIAPANVTVSVSATCGGAPLATAVPTSVQTILGTSRRMPFVIPAGLASGSYRVAISGSTNGGTTFASTACSVLSVAP